MSASTINAERPAEKFLELLANGPSNKEIAGELGIAEGSVKARLKTIFRKLGIRNRTQAALLANHHFARTLARSPSPEAGADDATAAKGECEKHDNV